MAKPLYPPVRTKITGEVAVVHHDQTRYGLRRICIASYGKYPDVWIWLEVLGADADPQLYRYVEKVTADSVFIGYLWIYWKPKRQPS